MVCLVSIKPTKTQTKKYSIENRSEETMDRKDKTRTGRNYYFVLGLGLWFFWLLSPFTLQAFLHPLRLLSWNLLLLLPPNTVHLLGLSLTCCRFGKAFDHSKMSVNRRSHFHVVLHTKALHLFSLCRLKAKEESMAFISFPFYRWEKGGFLWDQGSG